MAVNDTAPEKAAVADRRRDRLFPKYVAFFLAVVVLALVPNGLLDVWFSYQEQKELLFRIEREQAKSAAEKIGQFVNEIQGQMSWAIQLPVATESDDEWRLDAVRLLRQAPAVTEFTHLDAGGRERFRMSREAMDVVGSMSDFSHDPAFTETMTNKVYYGPIYFVHGSEPYMTLAVAGARPDEGVVVAQVNLKFIWQVVSQIKVGARGQAYVVDSRGQLIAHPDISLVLRKTDITRLAQVQAARELALPESSEHPTVALDLNGHEVLTAYARVHPLGWLVFADLPIEEVYAPFYEALFRSGVLLLAGLALAIFAGLFLARRMVGPIRTLSEGAAQIGSGDLTQRIAIKTGDELEALGDQFNSMATKLQESYATLERKVEERTRQLEIANQAKSRFLATASHDLRQPLHALGLFVAQLRGRTGAADRKRIVAGIEAALSGMNELFNALLDISKLDAGVLVPKLSEFPVAQLLRRIDTTFAGLAREKGLTLRIVGNDAWVRSDSILLEQIVLNLMTNAIRYTATGGVLVGCRRRGDRLRIEVWDTGSGIPQELHQHIFSEFYRVETAERDQAGGLGLGLAIVDRLCRLLDHPIELKSTVGKGSRFSITVPAVPAPAKIVKPESAAPQRFMATDRNLVVVIDDDPLVLEGMGGLIRSWGCSVVTGNTDGAVLDGLAKYQDPPNVIISDYHLRGGKTGIEAIARLRAALTAPIPAFLMSGDTNPDPQRDAQTNGYALLHKPVDPAALRTMLTQVLKQRPDTHAH
jgi:signal transduction histidine kinase/CheY-like chemotaxis protein